MNDVHMKVPILRLILANIGIEFDGTNWIHFIPTRGNAPQPKLGELCRTEVPVINFGWIRLVRLEIWSPVCYQVRWKLRYGKISNPAPIKESEENENMKNRAIFLRQKFIVNVTWNPIKHNLEETCVEDIEEFRTWIKTNYPAIKLPDDFLHSRIGHSKLWNGVLLVIVVTAVIGGLTRFRVGVPSHACWLLLWLYGGPVFRWKWLVNQSVDNKPCLSYLMWLLYEFCRALGWLILIGVYGGITVISVELFGAFCEERTISLSPGVWVGIGAIILSVLGVLGIIVSYYAYILGILP